MPYNSETETFYQAPATVVDSTPDGDTVQEGFDDRLTPALTALYDDLNLLKADGMISVGIPATTTARGIGRVATSADLVDGATITNGPAFLAAGTFQFTPTPTAHAVPQADAGGKLDGWVSLAGKANNDLSNLEPAAEEVIRSKMTLRNLGTRSTVGDWTLTDVCVGRPLWICWVPTMSTNVMWVSVRVRSGATIGSSPYEDSFYLGRAKDFGASNALFVIPTSSTVVIDIYNLSTSGTLYAEQI